MPEILKSIGRAIAMAGDAKLPRRGSRAGIEPHNRMAGLGKARVAAVTPLSEWHVRL